MFDVNVNDIIRLMENDDSDEVLQDTNYYVDSLKRDVVYKISKMSAKEKLEVFRHFFPGKPYQANFVDDVVKILAKPICEFVPNECYTSITTKEENFFDKLELILANRDLGIEEAIKKANVEDYNIKMRNVFCGPMG